MALEPEETTSQGVSDELAMRCVERVALRGKTIRYLVTWPRSVELLTGTNW